MAESLVDPGILSAALSVLAQESTAAAGRRISRSDQLSGDSQSMWSIAMTTPTQNAAFAYRTAAEAGAGRTRAETNRPEETSAAKPG